MSLFHFHPKISPLSLGSIITRRTDENENLIDEEKTDISILSSVGKDKEDGVSMLSDSEEQKAHFEKYANIRRKYINDETKLDWFQMFVVPQISCPTAVRVGSIGDGGKWVCNPWRAPKDCVIYSFGVNGDTSFESDMYDVTKKRCKFYSFDVTPQNDELFKSFGGTFRKWNISDKTDNATMEWSIIDIAKHFSHQQIDFIKIDIEANEYKAMPPFLNSTFISNNKVCQIFIEMHKYVGQWKSLQAQLEKSGFLMFYKEANMMCPSCYEYSYIHQSCLNRYGVKHRMFNKNF